MGLTGLIKQTRVKSKKKKKKKEPPNIKALSALWDNFKWPDSMDIAWANFGRVWRDKEAS